MRRLLGGLPLLALLAASPARAATDPPVPSNPADALALLKWCWENRDVARYHELFADNFRYNYADGDASGAPYQTTPWGRADELTSATGLFVGGSTAQAPASSIALDFTAGPQPAGRSFPGLTYPWHQQLVVPWTLDIARTDGSSLAAGGQSLWFLVRGDSAVIPQELKDRGFSPDPGRWYVERWSEQVDTPPIVRAPSEVSGKVSTPITVQITAQDPDGDPIASLSAASGVSSNFYPAADHTAGTFVWTPGQGDIGSHLVTFRAANALTGSATTTIKVLPPNLPPLPSLAVNPPTGFAPLIVTADASASTDPDGRIVSYVFRFGDGATLAQSVPVATHTYKRGTWYPTVTVTDDNNAADLAVQTVVVADSNNVPPVASLTVTPTRGNAPLNVTADASGSADADGRIVSYRFDFGDGSAVTRTEPVATHTYNGGIWPLGLTVTDDAGATASTSAKISVNAPPVASLVLSPTSGVAPLTVTADASRSSDPDSPIASYRFDFGDGTVVGPQASPTATHTYGGGRWTPSVQVADSGGAVGTDLSSVTASRPANEPPVAMLMVTPTSGTAPLAVTADASASYDPEGQIDSYQFDFGDGTVVAPLGSLTANHIYAAGHWTAKVRVTGWDGATASASATVDVAVLNQPPVAKLTVTPTSGVAPLTVTADASGSFDSDGRIVSYRFDFGDGASLTQSAPVATRTYGAGTWVLTLTVTDDRGATRSTTSTITVAPVPPPVDPPAASTPGNAVTLLRWCWENRDIARYQELFTGDFRFIFAPGDTAGSAYQDAPWSREDELTSATHLFAGGSATEPPASRIALTFAEVPQPVASPRPGLTYPWHQQLVVPWTLDITRSDGTTLGAGGQALWFLVRGDSALIPQELLARGFAPDSGRWYVERWEDSAGPDFNVDHAPLVSAPSDASGRAGTSIQVQLTAQDPDGDPIRSLTAESIAGSTFSATPDNTVGTFAWTPTADQVGSHAVTFTATNALAGSATTTVHVLPPNVPPVASLTVTPASGAEPLSVTADASGSSDPDGRIVSFRFDFGDGTITSRSTPIATHAYRAGAWTLTLTVTDDDGAARSASSTINVASSPDPLATLPNLVRNPSFEADTAGWRGYAGATIARVDGGYADLYALQMTGPAVIAGSFGVNDSPDWIRPTTATGKRYRFAARVFSPGSHGTAKLRVTEYLMATKARLGLVTSFGVPLAPAWQTVQVDYTTLSAGSTLDFQVRDFPLAPGEVFVTDDISIRDITGVAGVAPAEGEYESEPDDGPPLRPALYPSPVQTQAVLTFATSRPGALRVDLLDLAGRQVRRLADEIESPPGLHVLTIDGTGGDGRPMRPGMYFYRIEAEEGRRTGRFVMLR